MKVTLNEAKAFINQLQDDGLLYHFEDTAKDCLEDKTSYGRICRIQRAMDEIYCADLDWGEHECPIGYAINLIKADHTPAYNRGE